MEDMEEHLLHCKPYVTRELEVLINKNEILWGPNQFITKLLKAALRFLKEGEQNGKQL